MVDSTAADSGRYKRSSEAAAVPLGLYYELLAPAISALIDSTQTDAIASSFGLSLAFSCLPVAYAAVNGDLSIRAVLAGRRLG